MKTLKKHPVRCQESAVRSQLSGARNSFSGFTLIEFLIYFAILGIVVTAVTTFMLDVIQTRERVRISAEVEQNQRFGLQRIQRAIRRASGLNVGTSAFGDENGVLSLGMADPSVDPTVFDLSGGALRITEGAGSPVELTTPDVTVSKLWFERDDLPGGTKAITVQMTVEAVNPSGNTRYRYAGSASGTAVIRKQR